MDLLDRLRPPWRHSDPVVRAGAVRAMGDDEAERLATIAGEDPDARVRRVAIEKLADPEVLARVAERDADESLRALAADRLRGLLVAEAASDAPAERCAAALARLTDERSLGAVAAGAAHAAIREAALARVTSDRVLRDVVRQATDAALRRAALERIGEVAILRGLAVGDLPAELAVRAVERLGDPDALRAVAANRAAPKAARERARALLPDAPPLDDEGDVAAPGRPAEIAGVVDPREAAAHRARLALDEARRAREALCAQVAALEGPDALAALARARETWARLDPVPPAEHEAYTRRFREACDACVARDRDRLAGAASHERLLPLVREAESLAGSLPPPRPKRWNDLEERWTAARGAEPAGDAVAELERRFAAAKERVGEHRQQTDAERTAAQQDNLVRLTALHARLEELAAAEAVKPTTGRRELGLADTAIAEPGPLPPGEVRAAWIARLTQARDRLGQRLRQDTETEEWRRWANATAQEEIIQRVEALLEANDLAEGVRQLGRLQDEWAQVATATPEKSRPLWERFRTARNELRRRCDAWMTENLARKRALVEQLAGVAESTSWNETSELVRRLQAEWKAIGPVPGKHARALWQEFHEPCDRFFAQRKEHFARVDAVRGGNAERKTALCERAEALADSKDWDATTAVVKKLQADWKQLGPAPRAQEEALWQRFRAACNRFFDRRKRRDELEHEEELAKGQALCARLDAVAEALGGDSPPAADGVRTAVDEVWGEWQRLDLGTGKDVRPLRERLHAACERLFGAAPEGLRGSRLDPAATYARREKLCQRMEKLVPSADPAPKAAASLAEMAAALRDRLATNTIATGRGTEAIRADASQEAERLAQSWEQLGPPLDDAARALAERFAAARAKARRG
ncbi:MAG: DUF349 domain-containing protein [bacterium]|nr:DUF349 domain-containing protein [bacterium]